ncbi:MAG: pyridoxamine 5'-phosphate oxidase family protein [Alphaproteobacteria bacterium]|nr:pyridoxamine 5'-phosphate oxidase family protein [Alphaproteobacteria bacterium]
MSAIKSVAELESHYGVAKPNAYIKQTDHITPAYAEIIKAAPFVALATVGPEGLDCTPRGDRGSVVRLVDKHTLMMPDLAGNNRLDSLRNIVGDPRVALLFLVPGSPITLRVNGRAIVTADDQICAGFEVDGRRPATVIAIDVQAVYFQCAKALIRSDIWGGAKNIDPKTLPSQARMMAEAEASDKLRQK